MVHAEIIFYLLRDSYISTVGVRMACNQQQGPKRAHKQKDLTFRFQGPA